MGLIPDVALRLRLCLQQVAGSGLTAYLTVERALVTYPEFPWHHIANILPADWASFRLACTTVGNNQYFGIRNDLGPAKSTKFRNLTYIAVLLLTLVGGERAIREHAGLPKTCVNKPQIDEIIRIFAEAKLNALEP